MQIHFFWLKSPYLKFLDLFPFFFIFVLFLALQISYNQGFLSYQVLPKEDVETLELCRAMCKRGIYPPLMVRFDSCEG